MSFQFKEVALTSDHKGLVARFQWHAAGVGHDKIPHSIALSIGQVARLMGASGLYQNGAGFSARVAFATKSNCREKTYHEMKLLPAHGSNDAADARALEDFAENVKPEELAAAFAGLQARWSLCENGHALPRMVDSRCRVVNTYRTAHLPKLKDAVRQMLYA